MGGGGDRQFLHRFAKILEGTSFAAPGISWSLLKWTLSKQGRPTKAGQGGPVYPTMKSNLSVDMNTLVSMRDNQAPSS